MKQALFEKIRGEVGTVLGQSTEALDPRALYELVQERITAEREARRRAAGGHPTMTLNALLVLEQQMQIELFNWPRPAIV